MPSSYSVKGTKASSMKINYFVSSNKDELETNAFSLDIF